jgi:hypothetical protein
MDKFFLFQFDHVLYLTLSNVNRCCSYNVVVHKVGKVLYLAASSVGCPGCGVNVHQP